MVAKNTDQYIGQAIESILSLSYQDWDLIIVDDHSDDTTFRIAQKYGSKDDRIKPFKNPGEGKVIGLNFGYANSTGDVIKCIDSDDVLSDNFDDHVGTMLNNDNTCHDANIVNQDLRKVATYCVNTSILSMSTDAVIENIVALPKWTWSFNRDLAKCVFPIPESLPFEDVWFSFIIKINTEKIIHINEPLYLYRQHKNQTYGGLLNFDFEVVQFRAERILKLIDFLKKNSVRLLGKYYHFDHGKRFYELLAQDNIGINTILTSKLAIKDKIKLLLERKLSFFLPLAIRLKWKYDNYAEKKSK